MIDKLIITFAVLGSSFGFSYMFLVDEIERFRWLAIFFKSTTAGAFIGFVLFVLIDVWSA